MASPSGLHYDEDGRVVKRFDVCDGLAVRMLQLAGPATWTLSTAALVLPTAVNGEK